MNKPKKQPDWIKEFEKEFIYNEDGYLDWRVTANPEKVVLFISNLLAQQQKKIVGEMRMEIVKLRDENRGDMLGDIENLHKIGKEDAYIHVLNKINKKLNKVGGK